MAALYILLTDIFWKVLSDILPVSGKDITLIEIRALSWGYNKLYLSVDVVDADNHGKGAHIQGGAIRTSCCHTYFQHHSDDIGDDFEDVQIRFYKDRTQVFRLNKVVHVQMFQTPTN